jgi:hypothetical protein
VLFPKKEKKAKWRRRRRRRRRKSVVVLDQRRRQVRLIRRGDVRKEGVLANKERANYTAVVALIARGT